MDLEKQGVRLLELLKRTNHNQKIDLFNHNCSIIVLDLTSKEIIDTLLTQFEKNFRKIINCEIEQIYVEDGNLEIALKENFEREL